MKANNKYLDNYEDTQESNYIIYLDANNLYGYAVSECLPYGKRRWVKVELGALREILNIPDRSSTGYCVQCDLSFPEDIHETLREFPPAPENLTPGIEWLREFQKQVGPATGAVKDGKNLGADKLAPHLFQHKKYTLRYRSLKFLVKLGVQVDTIHSVVSF